MFKLGHVKVIEVEDVRIERKRKFWRLRKLFGKKYQDIIFRNLLPKSKVLYLVKENVLYCDSRTYQGLKIYIEKMRESKSYEK